MTKQDILDSIASAKASKELKLMVIAYVDQAYSVGFEEGMKAATKIQGQVFDLLMPKKEVKS